MEALQMLLAEDNGKSGEQTLGEHSLCAGFVLRLPRTVRPPFASFYNQAFMAGNIINPVTRW